MATIPETDLSALTLRATELIVNLGSDLFGAYNARMHGDALGAIARAAIECGFDVAVERPWPLQVPFCQGRKRAIRTARPDLTLLQRPTQMPLGFVEYESIDIGKSRLPYKRHLLTQWPSPGREPLVAIVGMTVPHQRPWGQDSPTRQDIEEHRTALIEASTRVQAHYVFLLVDAKFGVETFRFERGRAVDQAETPWDD